jgi:ketosteroid isomerase-like protein
MYRVLIRHVIVAIIISLVAMTGAQAAAVSADTQIGVSKTIDAYFTAVRAMNEKGLDPILTPDYVLITASGKKLDKDTAWKTFMAAANESRQNFLGLVAWKDATFVPTGEAVTVTINTQLGGSVGQGEGSIKRVRNSTHQMTVKNVNGKWLLAVDHLVSVKK